MRSRNIKPGFFKNELLAEVPFEYRLVFIGLWTMADREGRLEYRPKKIKIEIMPYDKISIESAILELQKRGFLIIYKFNQMDYLQIVNWDKHQNPHHKEIDSEIQPPDSNALFHAQVMHESCISHAQVMENGSCPTDSLLLIPDSLIPDSSAQAFDEFFRIFPTQRKGAKEKALLAWQKAIKRDSPENILTGARAYARSEEVKEGFAKGTAAWLNDDRWKTDYAYKSKEKEPKSAVY